MHTVYRETGSVCSFMSTEILNLNFFSCMFILKGLFIFKKQTFISFVCYCIEIMIGGWLIRPPHRIGESRTPLDWTFHVRLPMTSPTWGLLVATHTSCSRPVVEITTSLLFLSPNILFDPPLFLSPSFSLPLPVTLTFSFSFFLLPPYLSSSTPSLSLPTSLSHPLSSPSPSSLTWMSFQFLKEEWYKTQQVHNFRCQQTLKMSLTAPPSHTPPRKEPGKVQQHNNNECYS